jgi:hypothetical protein
MKLNFYEIVTKLKKFTEKKLLLDVKQFFLSNLSKCFGNFW